MGELQLEQVLADWLRDVVRGIRRERKARNGSEPGLLLGGERWVSLAPAEDQGILNDRAPFIALEQLKAAVREDLRPMLLRVFRQVFGVNAM